MSKSHSLPALLTYMKNYKLRMSVVFISFVVSNVALALVPIFIGRLVGALASEPPQADQAWTYVWILLACSTGHDITWRLSEYLYVRLLNAKVIAYENILFQQVIHKPYPYFVDKFTGKVSSYITTISQETKGFVEKFLWDYTDYTIRLIVMSAIFASVNWQTAAIFLTGLLIMVIAGRYILPLNIRYEKRWTDVQSTKNGKIIDIIGNFANVKSFHKEAAETQTVEGEQAKTIKAANTSFMWGIVFWAAMSQVIRNMIWPATIIYNVHLYLNGQSSVAELTTVLSTILLFSSVVWSAIWEISQFGLRKARMDEAYDYVFGSTNVVKDYRQHAQQPVQAPAFQQKLQLKQLRFAYPDKKDTEVLKSLNLTIKHREKIGIVGKSGSGKSTLTKLLLDYYELEAGVLYLDDQSVSSEELSKLISYVPQDTALFHRSISENIAYATDRKVTQQEIIHSARQAHADEFISKIDHGYDALVGERGVKLSAGQRQRIAIARAFLDDKPILILDEATSALDSESEVLVQKALEKLWQDKTVIAIAHRLSTLQHMDRIIVMDEGRIIEEGTHTELLKKKGKYALLWAHQSGGFLEE